MSTLSSTIRPGTRPTHPGALLADPILPALGVSVAEAARRMKVSRQTLYQIINGNAAVTPEMALRLGKFCGNGPDLWLSMQAQRDLFDAEIELRDELDNIPNAAKAA